MSDFKEAVVHFNVGGRSFLVAKKSFPRDTLFYKWFVTKARDHYFLVDPEGAVFIDRDPDSFGVILNYFRLRSSGQLWEACMPKDPDRLALLTQEAEYFHLDALRDQAIALLHACSEKSDAAYVSEVLSKSVSCPQGFNKRIGPGDEDDD